MIPPRRQWCCQIDVTNRCARRCSNCTRGLAHVEEPFCMTVPEFGQACRALAAFPTESEPDPHGRRKVVGMIGGEPLLHPDFPALARIMRETIPVAEHRGFWTGVRFQQTSLARHVELLVPNASGDTRADAQGGYLNHNVHEPPCYHQPLFTAARDLIPDEDRMWSLIRACPLQELWSATITPKGFFFCEVAGALDMVLKGPGGLPVTPDCWRHDLAVYEEQIQRWCPRCGICVPLRPRADREEMDDVSQSNLEALRQIDSPRIARGAYHLVGPDDVHLDDEEETQQWSPLTYMRPGPNP